VINRFGEVAFQGNLASGDVVPENNTGIWTDAGGAGLRLVAQKGSQIPGEPIGVRFSHLSHPELNARGQVAFSAFINWADGLVGATNDTGLWIGDPDGTLRLVVREGMPAPGATNLRLGAITDTTYAINNAGQLVLSTYLTQPGMTEAVGRGIWATDRSGELHLIAKVGDTIDVDDGPGVVLRTIQHLVIHDDVHKESGHATGFNDWGQVAFVAQFTDNSWGVFVSNAVAVPEPTTLVLLLYGLGALWRRRDRGRPC
jgi:hypothetical protein